MTFPDGLSPAQLLYPDLDAELASTRKLMALVPDGNDDFRPHDKSMKLGPLATHLAELPTFGKVLLTTDMLDFAATPFAPKSFSTAAERLEEFDRNASEFKSHVEAASWSDLAKRWQLKMGETVYVDDQKSNLVRSFAINHIAHHRAQLGVYLRMLGIPIPGVYGPSADEM
ncbi:MAG: DinB family protein [Gemmatimonadota bacterium]|nr:DinB family protein [Gemmatimonadota bacterium]